MEDRPGDVASLPCRSQTALSTSCRKYATRGARWQEKLRGTYDPNARLPQKVRPALVRTPDDLRAHYRKYPLHAPCPACADAAVNERA
ncbi:protein of unknown function [Desulfovibrio sp. 86]|nr:protein of unknown function [Desulfovibrio sp. 86]